MKKSYFLLIIFISYFALERLHAQCTNTTNYGQASAPTADGTSVVLTTCNYGGEYSTILNVAAATDYICTSNNPTDFLTVREGSPGGTAIASGTTPLSWTSTVSGTYYLHVNTNASCGSQTLCRTTSIEKPFPPNDCGTNVDYCYTSGFQTVGTYTGLPGEDISVVLNAGYFEEGYDSLKIYEGTGTGGTLLYESDGLVNGVHTSSTGSITVVVSADGSYSCADNGFQHLDFDVVCNPTPACGSNVTYCYSDGDQIVGTYYANPNEQLTIDINSGFFETSYDYLEIYEGAGTGGTLLYSSDGDVSGTSVTAASGILTVFVDADGSVNCGSESYSNLDFDLVCSPVTNCGENDTYCYGNFIQIVGIYTAKVDEVIKININSGFFETSYDYLEIYEGTGTGGTLLYSSDGDVSGDSIISTTNVVTVIVDADGAIDCGSESYSNLDFDITCLPPPCGDPSDMSASNITLVSADLTWTAGSGAETSWNIEWGAGSDFAPGTGAETGSDTVNTTPEYDMTGLTANTTYYVYYQANCGGSLDTSNWVLYTFNTLDSLCGTNYYDSGGSTGGYSNNEDNTIVFCPSNPSVDVVYLDFTAFSLENLGTTDCYDGLTIYNGPNTSDAVISPSSLGVGAGTNDWCWDRNDTSPSGTGDLQGMLINSTHSSGCLTVNFDSDGSVTRDGWEASVICAPPCTDPIIATQPMDTTKDCISTNDNTLNVVATGGGIGLRYQWQYFNGTSFVDVVDGTPSGSVYTGATTSSLGVSSISAAGSYKYRVLVNARGQGCNEDESDEAILIIENAPTAGTVSSSQTLCYDEDASNLTLSGNSANVIAWEIDNSPAFTNSPNNRVNVTSASLDGDSIDVAIGNSASRRLFARSVVKNSCPEVYTAPVIIRYNSPDDINTADGSGNCNSNAANTWVHIYDPVTDRIIASVNDKNQDLGQVDVELYFHGGNAFNITPSSGGCGSHAVMNRSYVINCATPSNIDASTGVDVRLYFTDAELDSLKSLAGCGNSNGCQDDDDVCSINDLVVTQITGLSAADEDGIFVDGAGTAVFHDNPTRVGPGNANFGANYVQINVKSFSEFWVHGSEHGVPLPVDMLRFEAKAIDNQYIMLDWTTATEINNSGFEIQRSEDGENFEGIAFVEGGGNTNKNTSYKLKDDKVEAKRYYYRLKQIDFDGQFEYSAIKSAQLKARAETIVGNFRPNPATKTSQIVFEVLETTEVEIELLDNLGRKVNYQKVRLQVGKDAINFDLDKFAAGVYTAKIIMNDKEYVRKLVVRK